MTSNLLELTGLYFLVNLFLFGVAYSREIQADLHKGISIGDYKRRFLVFMLFGLPLVLVCAIIIAGVRAGGRRQYWVRKHR